MDKSDTSQMRASDVAEAIVLLTRIPLRLKETRGVAGAWAWPLAGLVVGLIGAVVGTVGLWLGFGSGLAAGFALAAMIAATGAMHEDGLADCADGFWGGYTAERRLEIMKDSRIGTYGVLALVVSVLLRWAALEALFQNGYVLGPLLAVGVVSRVPMVAVMGLLGSARKGGLAGSLGRPEQDQIMLAAIAAGVVALLFAGFAAIPLAILAFGCTWGVMALAKARIGGQTGDVLGAAQQIGEIAMLAALVALWT